jgi:hypothetical protein
VISVACERRFSFLSTAPLNSGWMPAACIIDRQTWASDRLLSANSVNREGAALCKFGIEKDVEGSDLAIANNYDIQSGVVWGLAFRA